ncbi:hypothetical protein POX60_24535 [Escherichia coli]
MAGLSKIRIIFVEGETENSLFQKMIQQRVIDAKSIVKRNFWQESIRNYAITIPKGSDILIVFDSDEVEQSARFIENVKFLKNRGHKVYLLQQKRNFEEELAWCCGIPVKKLIAGFCAKKTSGINDFKRDFIACNNQLSKLLKMGMQETKWFTRDLHAVLEPVASFKSSFSKHFRLTR